jgi:uncharacterized membrane protein
MTDLSEEMAPTSTGQHEGWPTVRQVGFEAPWRWLELGWSDLWGATPISLVFGAIASVGALLIAGALVEYRALPLLLPLAGGFMIIGPLLAVALYEVSRCREAGQRPTLTGALTASYRASGRLALFGVLLLLIYFFWMRIAFLLFMLFFGTNEFPPLRDFISTLLLTEYGIELLVTGTLVGGILSAATFAVSAIAVPMLLDRPADPITASAVSVQAVVMNPKAMALWAALIAVATILGFATLFLGLIVTFPLLGYASWHAYRDLVTFEKLSR